MRAAALLLVLAAGGLAAWFLLGDPLGDEGAPVLPDPRPLPGLPDRPAGKTGTSLRTETGDATPEEGGGAVPGAPPRVAVWRPGEDLLGILVEPEPEREAALIDVPDSSTPRWGERVIEQLARHFYLRFRTPADWSRLKVLEPGPAVPPAARQAVPFHEVLPAFFAAGLEVHPMGRILWIRSRPGPGEEDTAPWPPPT